MMRISNLSKSFSGQLVLNNLSLEIQKGEVVALIGSSGAGKSTFLRSLNYLEQPDSGMIAIDDFTVDFSKISKEEILTLRRKLAMVFQQFNLFERRTALDNVKEGLLVVKKLSDREATTLAKEELAKVGLSDRENHYPRHLSGGQKRRVDIARALLSRPDILFLDEPTTGLDIQTRKSIWDLLYRLQKDEGMTIILTTHYLDEADEADQIYIVDHGKVIAQGSATAIKSQYASNILKIRFKEMKDLEKLLQTGMTVEEENELEYLFYPRTSQEAIEYLTKVREEIDSFEFRPGTMDDAFIALTGREVR